MAITPAEAITTQKKIEDEKKEYKRKFQDELFKKVEFGFDHCLGLGMRSISLKYVCDHTTVDAYTYDCRSRNIRPSELRDETIEKVIEAFRSKGWKVEKKGIIKRRLVFEFVGE